MTGQWLQGKLLCEFLQNNNLLHAIVIAIVIVTVIVIVTLILIVILIGVDLVASSNVKF